MKIARSLCVITLLLIANVTFSQTSVLPSIGANFSTRQYVYKGQVDETQYDQVKGFRFGAELEHQLSDVFSITGGVSFDSRGYSRFSTITYINGYKNPPDTTQHRLEYKHHIFYLDVPINIKFKYYIDPNTFFYGKSGGYVGYGIGGTSTTFGVLADSTGIYFTPGTGKYNLKQSNERRLDFGMNISFGIEIQHFFFEATYALGLRNLADKNATDLVTRNKSVMLSLGYRIQF